MIIKIIANADMHYFSVAQTVNTALTLLYWKIGKRIKEEVLQHKRADYGMQVVLSLAEKLTQNYGQGWSEKQLRDCLYVAWRLFLKNRFSTRRVDN